MTFVNWYQIDRKSPYSAPESRFCCPLKQSWLGGVVIDEFENLTEDELFDLHTEVTAALTEKLLAKKDALDERLRQLRPLDDPKITPPRRPYPPVKAKFRNPDRPAETWSGRGKRPRWLEKQLSAGSRIDDFRIAS
jgi:DNA-binding protein H-NS